MRRTSSDQEGLRRKGVEFWEAFRFWVKLGFINFGGPAGQIAIMHRELVGRKRWVSEGQFLRTLNFCMLFPGPETQQVATYIVWGLHGTLGVVAGPFFVIHGMDAAVGSAGKTRWLILIYHLPREPSRHWGAVWHKLKALSALYLQAGAFALPEDAVTCEQFESLQRRIREASGEVTLWEVLTHHTDALYDGLHA